MGTHRITLLYRSGARIYRAVIMTVGLTVVVVGLSGCGNGLSTLEGTVLVDGKPAPEGISLSFAPSAADGSPSYATTDANGRFEAAYTFRDVGILPGEHRVHLLPGGLAGDGQMPEIGANGQPVRSAVDASPKFPQKYYQEIQKITVEPGSNEINIELTTVKNTSSG